MIQSKLYESKNLLLWKIILKNLCRQHQPTSCSYHCAQSLSIILLKSIYDQNSVIDNYENWTFPWTFIHEALFKCNSTQECTYDPTKFSFQSFLNTEVNCLTQPGENFKKLVSFDDVMHLADKKTIVSSVGSGCGVVSYREARTKSKHITKKRKTLPRPVKAPCISQVTINVTLNGE